MKIYQFNNFFPYFESTKSINAVVTFLCTQVGSSWSVSHVESRVREELVQLGVLEESEGESEDEVCSSVTIVRHHILLRHSVTSFCYVILLRHSVTSFCYVILLRHSITTFF